MLTDAALKQLKPKGKPYKVADRDGMYAHVSASGTVTFRHDYRLNGRRETIVLGRFTATRTSVIDEPFPEFMLTAGICVVFDVD